MPRAAGTLVRFRCCTCGTPSAGKGGGRFARCTSCRTAGIRLPRQANCASYADTGGQVAMLDVKAAISDGILLPATAHCCDDCGKPATEYDHRDYNQTLVVSPVCRSCNLKRGPAVPVHGSLEQIISGGRVPYRRRRDAQMLLALLGGDASIACDLPALLTLEHWKRRILPAIPAPHPTTAQEG